MKSKKFTERIVQARLFQSMRTGVDLAVPNYTPEGWWECDFWHVTKAGYAVEHEIKLTRADFLKDAEKTRERRPDGWNSGDDLQVKHEQIAEGKGPRQFWFVTPAGLLDPSEIPEWAGLKELNDPNSLTFKTVKKAPFLNSTKVSPKILRHAQSVFYYRFWNIRTHKPEIEPKIEKSVHFKSDS